MYELYEWSIGHLVIIRAPHKTYFGKVTRVFYENPPVYDTGLIVEIDLDSTAYPVPQSFRKGGILKYVSPGYYTYNIDNGLVGQGYTRGLLTIQ